MLLLNDIEHYFLTELTERLTLNKNAEVSDVICEVVKNHIPQHYADLLSIASISLWLAVEEPKKPAKTAIQAISYNLYKHLVELGYEKLDELQETSQKEE